MPATTSEARVAVISTSMYHNKPVMTDRGVVARGNCLAGQHAQNPTSDGVGQVLKATIDGLALAKF